VGVPPGIGVRPLSLEHQFQRELDLTRSRGRRRNDSRGEL